MSAKAKKTIDVEDGVLTTPDGHALPRVVDKNITMDVVQRFVETERMRNRRAILFLGTGFIFVILAVLVLFVGIGIYVLRHTRRATDDVTRAAEAVDEMRDHTATVAAEMVDVTNQLTGVSSKLTSLESWNQEVASEVRGHQQEVASNDKALKADLVRFRNAVVNWNSSKTQARMSLEKRIAEMEARAMAREQQLASLQGKYSELLASGVEKRATLKVDPIAEARAGDDEPDHVMPAELPPTPEVADTSFEDITDIGPLVTGEPSGEISVVTFPNGDRYQGEFKNGFFDGWGTLHFRNGDRYEGDFKNDAMSGKGIYYYKNGDRYEGEFGKNMKSGRGRMLFANGDRYSGGFKNDMITGKGIMIYKNGNKYAGDFRNGLKQGNGMFSYSNGDVYEGDFDEDLRSGRGTYSFGNGAKYIGQFKAGKKHGDGRYIYPNGQEYRGEFRDGKKHGSGLCIYPNGKELRGLWENDEFIRETRS